MTHTGAVKAADRLPRVIFINMLQRTLPHGTGKKSAGPTDARPWVAIKIWYARAAHNPCTSCAQVHLRSSLKAVVSGHTSSGMTAMVRQQLEMKSHEYRSL